MIQKVSLAAATILCAATTAALTFVAPGSANAVVIALALFTVANVGFELGNVFYFAYLPDITAGRTPRQPTAQSIESFEKGLALVPLRLYFKEGRAKIELGLGRGKTLYDKRRTIAERDARREADRAIKAARRR